MEGGLLLAAAATVIAVVAVKKRKKNTAGVGAPRSSGPSEPIDPDDAATRFLALLPPDKRARAERALAVVIPAYREGTIFNVDYEDAKGTLSRLVDLAYEEKVQKPFLWGKGYTEVSKIDHEIGSVSNLHEVITTSKKVERLKPPGDYGDARRAFAEAALPLAMIMADLKTKIVKGRKPAAPEVAAQRAAVAARKNIQTCSVCFRGIAVLSNGRIADHGYTLPHRWHKTASCPGSMFRPLESSSPSASERSRGSAPKTDRSILVQV